MRCGHDFRFEMEAHRKSVRLDMQDGITKEITVSQSALKLSLPARARAKLEEQAAASESLRECNGALQWLTKKSRPDLPVQRNISQEALTDAKVRDGQEANNIIHRAKQRHEMIQRILPNSSKAIRPVMQTNAAFQNAPGGASQAGYLVAVEMTVWLRNRWHHGVCWSGAVAR